MLTRESLSYNLLVPHYLMAAYVYYYLDDQLITDAEFDKMAVVLLEHWDTVTHRHKHLITIDSLKAGSLLLSEEDYPEITKDTARHLLALKQEEKTTRRRARKIQKQE
jgi:hypothetical protein